MNQRARIATLAPLAGASLALAAACGPAPEPATGTAVSPPLRVVCPSTQILVDSRCVPDPRFSVSCPGGAIAADGQCRPAPITCPTGTHVSPDDATCVPDAVAASPQPQAAPPEAPASPCPAGMALVKGGTFKFGILKAETTVADVCLDVTEVTTKDYEACVTGGKCNANFVDACTETTTYKKPGKQDHPMVCVDFTQSETYCKTQGKRLPAEEEWEWAARAGAEARTYSWGNEAPAEQVCWSGKATRTGTCPVNAHPGSATPAGLLGMSGNVFEWTTSKLDSKGKDRVGRGGSWRDGLPNLLLVARPGRFEVTYRCGFLGIRCATEPTKK